MRLTIVVCAYNEEKSIGPLLENLLDQRVTSDVVDREIIVVASGCTDKTVPRIREKMSADSSIRLIEEDKRLGKASALNKAFQAASGDYIVLVPADVQPAKNALYKLLTPFTDKSVSAVSGRPTENPENTARTLAGHMAQTTYRLWEKLMKSLNSTGQVGHCSGEFMAIRSNARTVIPTTCAADDSYLAVNAKKKGTIMFAADAVCYNLLPCNIIDYIDQRRRWLYGHLQTKHATGEYPTVIDTMILSKPRIALQLLTKEAREQPTHIQYLVAAIAMETLIYLLSVADHVFHRQHGVWSIIRSTKYT